MLEKNLWVVVPAHNEEQCLAATIDSLRTALPYAQLLVVDNASTDSTARVAREVGVDCLMEPRKGKGYAVLTGIDFALAQGAQWVALHDADNEYNAQDLKALYLRCLEEDGPHPVMGVGLREVTLAQVHWRSLLANWAARLALKIALKKTPPLDILTGTRIFNAQAALKLVLAGAIYGFELETALTRRAMLADARFCFVPVRYTPRALGEKKIKASDMWPILKAAFGR